MSNNTQKSITRSAFVTIAGRPNVGKSTLMNALLGQKIAIVSNKPQTTRNRILGIMNEDGVQLVLVDTPGLHLPRTKLGMRMMKAAREAVSDGDLLVLVVEPTPKPMKAELDICEAVKLSGYTAILAVNKVDAFSKDKVAAAIEAYSQLCEFASVVPLSALKNDGVDIVKRELLSRAAEGPAFFPDDALTDQPEKLIAAEMLREKALMLLSDEIPHGIAVDIEHMREREGADMLDISAVLYCEKKSHKPIIIGKGGAMLKAISSRARQDMEEFFGCKVFLEVWVKVKENWRDSDFYLKNFGYSDK